MKVTVRLFETLKDIAGSGKIEVNLPEGTDIESLLTKLSRDYGADLESFLIDEKTKKARTYLQIIVDGKYTSFLERKNTTLKDGSVVTILPPIGGG